MKAFLTIAATFVAATAFSAMLAGDASAADFCRRDVTGHMLSCSFATMAQCEATRYGLGGDCLADPFKAYHPGVESPGNATAYAYQPRPVRLSRHVR